jgi:hypothetical protein
MAAMVTDARPIPAISASCLVIMREPQLAWDIKRPQIDVDALNVGSDAHRALVKIVKYPAPVSIGIESSDGPKMGRTPRRWGYQTSGSSST